jgi:hypothetical protein
LGDALFGSDDVNDSLLAAAEVKVGDTKFDCIFPEFRDHGGGEWVSERFDLTVRGHNVVDRGEGSLRVGDLESKVPEHTKGLRARHFMNEMCIDEELGLPIGECADHV